jgi:uncharacterized protein
MVNMQPRENIGLAFDGGGVRGVIPTIALQAVEANLGSPLINNQKIKVLAGTSTGAIIASALAMGLNTDQLMTYYQELSSVVFPFFQPGLYSAERFLRQAFALLRKSMYDGKAYRKRLTEIIEDATQQKNFTLGHLNARLNANLAHGAKPRKLIITVMDVYQRRTRFLKSSDIQDKDWLLADAILASSAAPTYLPVFTRKTPSGTQEAYVDGGVGNYNNPAYIVARELLDWTGYEPQSVSVWSFGTGYLKDTKYREITNPEQWNILAWAKNTVSLLMADAAQAQLQDIIHDIVNRGTQPNETQQIQIQSMLNAYMTADHPDGIDFRRYQVRFDDTPNNQDIDLADSRPATAAYLVRRGEELKRQLEADEYAPYGYADDEPVAASEREKSARIDPEGVWKSLNRYSKSLSKK